MEHFNPETFETKFTIAEAAVKRYVDQGGTFTLKDIARDTDLSVGELFNYFPDKKSILEFWYASLVIRYRMMIDEIDDFQEYSLSEKLSNFAYASFDLMREHHEFVEQSFRPVIECSPAKSGFEKAVENLLQEFFENDAMISSANRWLLNSFFYGILRKQFVCTVRFWLEDESEGQEKTMVYVDKTTAVIQEAFYNAFIDRGIDLLKFLAENKFFIRNIPIVKRVISNFEIRE